MADRELTISHDELEKLKASLNGVRSNAQGLAAVTSVLNMAGKLTAILRSEGGAFRDEAAKSIDEYAKRVRDTGKDLQGSPTMAVGKTWDTVKKHVLDLYIFARIIEQTMPPDVDLGDGWGPALSYAYAELPNTISHAADVVVAVSRKAVNKAVTTVKEVGVAVGGAAGSIAWAAIKPLLPVLLVAGVGVGVYVYALRKGLL